MDPEDVDSLWLKLKSFYKKIKNREELLEEKQIKENLAMLRNMENIKYDDLKDLKKAGKEVFMSNPFSQNLSLALIGLTNVGKTSTFNLLSGKNAPATDMLYQTWRPNLANVTFRDDRFKALCKMWSPTKRYPSGFYLKDLASFSKNCVENPETGVGNAFMKNLHDVDCFLHVVRAFENEENEVYVKRENNGKVDPVGDIKIVNNELIKKDLKLIKGIRNETRVLLLREKGHMDKGRKHNYTMIKDQMGYIDNFEDWLKQGKFIKEGNWNQE